jgi:leucyl-tRNA synthetase
MEGDSPKTDDKGRGIFLHTDGSEVRAEYFKMSKTRLNIVSAGEMGEALGVDTQRLYTLAVGPAELDAEWIEQGVIGYHRFLKRSFKAVVDSASAVKAAEASFDAGTLSGAAKDLRRVAHETIKRMSAGLELDKDGNFGFHTAISALITFEHAIKAPAADASADEAGAYREVIEIFVRLLAPFAPHLAEELWQSHLGKPETVFHAGWPVVDEAALKRDSVEIAVQVKGKIKARAEVPADADEATLRPIVLEIEAVKEAIAGKEIKKFIVVKNRLVNIVAI